jgi:DNA-binding SARP family transcriptional activator
VSAVTQIQGQISQLRRALDPGRAPGAEGGLIVTQPPGYAIRPRAGELDLSRFEDRVAGGRRSLAAGDAAGAGEALREALALWRGPALADLGDEPFVSAAKGRLEEMRLSALEARVEADLAAGRHAELVGELQELTAAEPLRERLRWLLMLSLYRCGRQADALAAALDARRTLDEEVGLAPGPELRDLERAIRLQDASLDLPAAPAREPRPAPPQQPRAILVAGRSADALDSLVPVAAPLAAGPERELLVVHLLPPGGAIGEAARELEGRRQALAAGGAGVRAADFTTADAAADLTRLAAAHEAELLVLEAPGELLATGRPSADLAVLLRDEPGDVALLLGRPGGWAPGPVVVPFAGAEHDWAALEVGARLARALDRELVLLGEEGDESRGRRDASRLLASASLAVQGLVGVAAQPRLVAARPGALAGGASDAALLLLAFSGGGRSAPLGPARLALARETTRPTLLVRRGVRPGGLAPREAMSRLTWSLEGPAPRPG